MQTLIDFSHTIFDGLITCKGLPAPIICDYLSRENSKLHYEEGTSFQINLSHLILFPVVCVLTNNWDHAFTVCGGQLM